MIIKIIWTLITMLVVCVMVTSQVIVLREKGLTKESTVDSLVMFAFAALTMLLAMAPWL